MLTNVEELLKDFDSKEGVFNKREFVMSWVQFLYHRWYKLSAETKESILDVASTIINTDYEESYSKQKIRDLKALVKKIKTVQERKRMTRKEKWLKVIEALNEVGSDLNTVGNEDFNELDYYYKHQVELIMEGYKKTYDKS